MKKEGRRLAQVLVFEWTRGRPVMLKVLERRALSRLGDDGVAFHK